MYSKQILNYFLVCESFVCIVHVITIYTIKINFLGCRPNPNCRAFLDLVNFQHGFCMTQKLRILPYNYWILIVNFSW